jgi:hypothetical protein
MLTVPAKEEEAEAAPAAAAAAAFLPKRDTFYDGLPNIDRVFELDHAGIREAAIRGLRFWLRLFFGLSSLAALMILYVKFDPTSTEGLVKAGIIVIIVIIGVGAYAVLEFVLRGCSRHCHRVVFSPA